MDNTKRLEDDNKRLQEAYDSMYRELVRKTAQVNELVRENIRLENQLYAYKERTVHDA